LRSAAAQARDSFSVDLHGLKTAPYRPAFALTLFGLPCDLSVLRSLPRRQERSLLLLGGRSVPFVATADSHLVFNPKTRATCPGLPWKRGTINCGNSGDPGDLGNPASVTIYSIRPSQWRGCHVSFFEPARTESACAGLSSFSSCCSNPAGRLCSAAARSGRFGLCSEWIRL
jgi:hypothetical protein